MLIAIPEVWRTAEADHLKYVSGVVEKWLKEPHEGPSKKLRELVLKHRKDIAIGNPGRLRGVIASMEESLGVLDEEDRVQLKSVLAYPEKFALGPYEPTRSYWLEFMKECERLFNYTRFTTKQKHGWDAYGLCNEARCRICPYCQQAYAFTLLVDEHKIFRPTLDHFYAKSIYPYLGISLYNLVPSCYTCNSALKRDIDFLADNHLHPLEDSEDIRFEVDPLSLMDLKDNRTQELMAVATPGRNNLHAQGSCETFRLSERYALNGYELAQFVDALHSWTQAKITELSSLEGEAAERFKAQLFLFDPKNYGKELLGRMKKDVLEQFRQESAKRP